MVDLTGMMNNVSRPPPIPLESLFLLHPPLMQLQFHGYRGSGNKWAGNVIYLPVSIMGDGRECHGRLDRTERMDGHVGHILKKPQ